MLILFYISLSNAYYYSNYNFFKQFIVFNNILFNLIGILFYRSTLDHYDLSAFHMSLLMFYMFY